MGNIGRVHSGLQKETCTVFFSDPGTTTASNRRPGAGSNSLTRRLYTSDRGTNIQHAGKESFSGRELGHLVEQVVLRFLNDQASIHPPRKIMLTRWSTTLSSKVNLTRVIDFRALYGADLVTLDPGFEGNETLVIRRVGPTAGSQWRRTRSSQARKALSGAGAQPRKRIRDTPGNLISQNVFID